VTTGWHKPPVGGPPSVPSSPAVMLSPNATNRVTVSVGGATTVIANEHGSVRCSASVAVQLTVVCPMANADPESGVQETVTGALPLTTVGLA